MPKKEARSCWEFWNCDSSVMHRCPACTYSTGNRCWELAGTGCKNPFCFLLRDKYRYCWECPWFKKVNPGFFS